MQRPATGAGVKLAALAQWAGVELRGDPELHVDRVATLESAGSGAVSFFANPRYGRQLAATRATAVIVAPDALDACPVAALVTPNPYLVFARVTRYFNPEPSPQPGVHPSACVADGAELGEGVAIAARAVIEPGARLGARVCVGAGAYIGADAVVGADSRIAPNAVVGARARLGERVILHSGVVIGADGFGFASDGECWEKVPQIGSVQIGNDVEVGANTAIDRGALGDTVIEDGVKLDNLIQVGHNARIGAHTVVAACTAIAGSTSIGRGCMIAGAVAIAGHLSIADGVTVTGMTTVSRSIAQKGVYSGGTQMAENAVWRKSAVRFNQLDDMFRRLRRLEQELAALKGPTDQE
jgi:UDP-3-O-[3-hydroxymyristoyl] glucosamine N-acyltransferase